MASRERERRDRQFGSDGKREWVMAKPCVVTGTGGGLSPSDPSHIDRTRAAGAGPERMLPMRRDVHTAYGSMGAARFEEVWGISHARLIEMADEMEREWQMHEHGLAD